MKAKSNKQWNACRQHCQISNRNRRSLPTNAKSPCYQPGLDVPDSKTPMVMMMLLKEERLYARGILECATVVADKTPWFEGETAR
jgi:hypothetical protein